MIRQPLQLAITGFIQVYFVSVNTYFLAHHFAAGVLVAAFAISYIWSINVKKVAFGTRADRVLYATGAALGSWAGLHSANFILELMSWFINH